MTTKLDAELEKRLKERKNNKPITDKKEPEPLPVSAGPVGQIVDVLINPSGDKMLEFTSLDQNQVRLIPELMLIDDEWEYCIKLATYRYDSRLYEEVYGTEEFEKPTRANQIKKFIYLTAQCRRSLVGKEAFKNLSDLALADIETRANEDKGQYGSFFPDEE